MRYEINKQYPFLIIQFARVFVDAEGRRDPSKRSEFKQDVVTFYPFPTPPFEDELIGVHVSMLTCKEHHRVPNAWDSQNRLDNDGFIFEDDAGRVWYNQYPRASYGQMSDEADRRVWMHVVDNEAAKAAIDNGAVYEMELATNRLCEIRRAVWQFAGNTPKWQTQPAQVDEPKLIAMQKLFDIVRKAIEECAGKQIVLDKLMVQDGTADAPLETMHWLEGHWKARFEDEPEHGVAGFRKKTQESKI